MNVAQYQILSYKTGSNGKAHEAQASDKENKCMQGFHSLIAKNVFSVSSGTDFFKEAIRLLLQVLRS